MPAEWEPQESLWLVWPHNESTWPVTGLDRVREVYALIIAKVTAGQRVDLIVQDGAAAEAAAKLLTVRNGDDHGVRYHTIPTNDSWVRDFGPTWVQSPNGRRAIEWTFNSWGEKYPPWDLDAAAAAKMAGCVGDAVHHAGFVMEGGAIDVDGRGLLLTTDECLLNANREAGRTRQQMEDRLGPLLGVSEFVWLRGGGDGDDTDGHVDNCARCVPEGRVLAAWPDSRQCGKYETFSANYEILERWSTTCGADIVPVPVPDGVVVDGSPVPASYLNFVITNACVLVPIFGHSADWTAVATLERLFPGREVVPINGCHLLEGLGGPHCLSQQLPHCSRF